MKVFLKKNLSFFVFLMVMIGVRWSFADQYRVPTGSMEPTIHIGDHVFINKMAYALKLPFTDIILGQMHNPTAGDIIVFRSPDDPSINLIKRLIAVSGDHVRIEDGQVFINGKSISTSTFGNPFDSDKDEIFTSEAFGQHQYQTKRLPRYARRESFEFLVPPDRFFFMGDNRDNSHDGRYFGLVDRKDLKGQALVVLWNIYLKNGLPRMELNRIGASL